MTITPQSITYADTIALLCELIHEPQKQTIVRVDFQEIHKPLIEMENTDANHSERIGN